MDFSSLRSNCVAGVIQTGDRSVHATEWWNGEGVDFLFETETKNQNNTTKRIELHLDEIAELVTLAIAMEFVDIEECVNAAQEMKIKEVEHNLMIEKFAMENSK